MAVGLLHERAHVQMRQSPEAPSGAAVPDSMNRSGNAVKPDAAAFVAEILGGPGNGAVHEAHAPDATAARP